MTTFYLRTKLHTNRQTQRTIAERAGVSQSLVSRVLRGERPPSFRVLAAIAAAADLDEGAVRELLPPPVR